MDLCLTDVPPSRAQTSNEDRHNTSLFPSAHILNRWGVLRSRGTVRRRKASGEGTRSFFPRWDKRCEIHHLRPPPRFLLILRTCRIHSPNHHHSLSTPSCFVVFLLLEVTGDRLKQASQRTPARSAEIGSDRKEGQVQASDRSSAIRQPSAIGTYPLATSIYFLVVPNMKQRSHESETSLVVAKQASNPASSIQSSEAKEGPVSLVWLWGIECSPTTADDTLLHPKQQQQSHNGNSSIMTKDPANSQQPAAVASAVVPTTHSSSPALYGGAAPVDAAAIAKAAIAVAADEY